MKAVLEKEEAGEDVLRTNLFVFFPHTIVLRVYSWLRDSWGAGDHTQVSGVPTVLSLRPLGAKLNKGSGDSEASPGQEAEQGCG